MKDVTFSFLGTTYEQQEHLFRVIVEAFEIDTSRWTQIERQVQIEHRWWTRETWWISRSRPTEPRL